MATLPVVRPLRVHQGNTKRIPFQWYTDTTRSTGVDKTGCSYEGSIETTAGVLVATATIVTTDIATGRIEAVFSHVDTATLSLTEDYVYDVVETNASGDVTTLVTGPVEVTAAVTL